MTPEANIAEQRGKMIKLLEDARPGGRKIAELRHQLGYYVEV